MQLIILEDEFWKNFKPLSYTRACFGLMNREGRLIDQLVRIVRHDGITAFIRDYLAEVEKSRYPNIEFNTPPPRDDEAVIINALLRDISIVDRLLKKTEGREFVLFNDGRVMAARVKGMRLEEAYDSSRIAFILSELAPRLEGYVIDGQHLYSYPWELLETGEPQRPLRESGPPIDPRVAILGEPSELYIGENVEIEPFTVLDARRGPLIIERGCRIASGSVLIGPCRVGRETEVLGGRVGPEVFTGPVCRISGEIEHTIVLGYSNKRHLGYLGHSLVGEWVNIGAGTVGSNLKNTYGEIRVEIESSRVSSGRQFLGQFIGDHARTSVGTSLMCGKKLGCFTMSMGIVSRDIPPFVGVSPEGRLYVLELSSEIMTAERMMNRRKVEMTDAYRRLVEKLYEITAPERATITTP
ncbi:MAG: putative sugar nucleotidyl transferase [Nitrososphaerota archaeon]